MPNADAGIAGAIGTRSDVVPANINARTSPILVSFPMFSFIGSSGQGQVHEYGSSPFAHRARGVFARCWPEVITQWVVAGC